jgi:hypothetical protein
VQTSTITSTLRAENTTITQTLPAQTFTITQTIPGQNSTITETDTLPAQTETTADFVTLVTRTTLPWSAFTITRTVLSLPTSTLPSVVAPYGLIQYSAFATIFVKPYGTEFYANRYQIDSNGVLRTVQYCSKGCNNPWAAVHFNDTGYTMYYDPKVGLQLSGGSAGSASKFAMFADGDPVAGSYAQANCTVGPNSLLQCYWDNTGV